MAATVRKGRTPITVVPPQRGHPPGVGAGGERRFGAAARRGKTTHTKPKPPKPPRSPQQQTRADKPVRYRPATHPDLGAVTRFRVTALFANGSQQLDIVERLTWEDASALTTGSLVIRVPRGAPEAPENRLDQGDRVMLEASTGGEPWREVWTLRVSKPQATASSLQRSFDLVNDLDLLLRSEDNFYYRRNEPDILTVAARSKKGGWTGPEIIRDVCAQFRVPIAALYTQKRKLKKLLVRRGSPLEVIRIVMRRERRKHNLRLVLRYDRGQLSVVPLIRSPFLLALGPTLIEAAFQSEMPEQFTSAITMHGLQEFVYGQAIDGRDKKNRQKMHLELENAASVRQFGYVHRIVFSPDARNDAELREEGNAYLAAVSVPRKTVTVTHKGMPFLRRGHAIKLALGDTGLRKQVCWVNSVSHQVSATGYTMDVQLIFDDPYRDNRHEKLLWRLKATHDQAVGRSRGPFWYLPKNKKADAVLPTSQPFTVTDPSTTDPTLPGDPTPAGPF